MYYQNVSPYPLSMYWQHCSENITNSSLIYGNVAILMLSAEKVCIFATRN